MAEVRITGSLIAATVATVLAAPARSEVEIRGIEDELLANALRHAALDDEPCDAPDWRIREQFDRAHRDIRTALEAYGYYGVSISSDLTFEDECWHAGFDVDPGEPTLLRNVRVAVTGAAESDPVFQNFLARAVPAPGDVLSHSGYDALKRELTDIAQRRGYAEARFQSNRIDVYPDQRAADIELTMNSGPRFVFGAIEIAQDVLDPELVQRYVRFSPGEPFHRDQLSSLYGALADSGYFDVVDVRALPAISELRQIPVSIQLTPARRRMRSFGVGYSTDTGPRIRLDRTNRRVNSGGAQSGIHGQLSPVISEVLYNYRFPYGDPRSEWISYDAGMKHEDTETSVSDTFELGVRRVIRRRNDWQETQFLDLLVEDFELADIKSRSRLLRPGISWLNIRADDLIRPNRGLRLNFEISGAGDSLGSDTSFLQLIVGGKWVRSFGESSRLLVRGQAGVTWVDRFEQLPPTVRFFTGGDNSIRGYKFESLGPTDAEGHVIGGSRLLVASIEYERALTAKWSIATFLDSGNAFDGKDFEPVSGAGVGIRWQSPLGPIRVDVAKPLDGLDRDVRLHVTLGADL